MKRNKILLASEDGHDYVFLSALTLLSQSEDDFKFIICPIHSNKLIRLNKHIDEIVKVSKLKIKFIKLYKSSASINRPLIKTLNLIKLLLNKFILFINYLLNSRRIHSILILDLDYIKMRTHRFTPYLKNRNKKISKILLVHLISHFEEITSSNSRKIHQNIDGYIVLSEYLISELNNYVIKPIFVLPASLPTIDIINEKEKFILKKSYNLVKFVVIGRITNQARDYIKIIDALSALKIKYEVLFLGELREELIIDYALQKRICFRYFKDGYVSDEIMTKEIINSHYILNFRSIENKKQLNISGNIYDSLRFATPLISNSHDFALESINHIYLENIDEFVSYFEVSKISSNILRDNRLSLELSKQYTTIELSKKFYDFLKKNISTKAQS